MTTKINDWYIFSTPCFSWKVDRKLCRAFADQIFLSGFVHADPHPGNGKHLQTKYTCCYGNL